MAISAFRKKLTTVNIVLHFYHAMDLSLKVMWNYKSIDCKINWELHVVGLVKYRQFSVTYEANKYDLTEAVKSRAANIYIPNDSWC